ncbi:TRAP transporter small permease [Oceanobacillus polygoni]|uniref:TRAP-type C4-dicarboxylate transport system permease small subunit n=1 Tax=Oceanobacillus polygoni TaxID=1235259 RepID=A0A9X1CEA8_9BACI|nr:TRAP transporter small permease [Oceanobacillus polygoni]MBP2076048.1 TRAP-type C4-dicarboxylate transport system permease small subunit [Oceanobacillus polygoni]
MEKLITKLNTGLLYVAQVVLIIMVFLVTADVLGRWLFSQPITGAVELTELGLSMVIFLSIAYTHLKEEHISIDFLVERLPEKVQWIVEALINLIIMVLMVLMALSLFWYAERLFTSGTVTGDLGLPIYLFAGVSGIGAIVFALTAILLALKYVAKVGER